MFPEKKHILVIEDNEADAVIIEKALATVNFECQVTRIADGEEAMTQLLDQDRRVPDLILLDLNMPRSDGLDILRRIRSTPRLTHIPVGILTGSQASGDESRASLIGAARYIRKPLGFSDFVQGVRTTVEELLADRHFTQAG